MSLGSPAPAFGKLAVPEGVEICALGCQVGPLTCCATANTTADPASGLPEAEHLSLFIPGFSGSKEDFLQFLPRVAGEDRAAVSYSQRGQADSASPDGIDSYGLDSFVADACEVLELLGAQNRRVDLVGHSFGGVVARRVALARPELLRSLTIFSSGATAMPVTAETREQEALLKRVGSSFIYRGNYPDRADEEQPEPDVETNRLRAHATSLHNLLSIGHTLVSYRDVTSDLIELHRTLPMLVVHGADDLAWPDGVYDAEARALGLEQVVIDGAGHSAQRDQPEAFAASLREFWNAGVVVGGRS